MKTYTVKSNLKHDGELYTKGQEIELEEKVAVQLLSDNIIVEPNDDVNDEERETPQPPVNKVSREGDETTGEAKVEPGKVDKPQPGDEVDNKPETPKYKVLKGLEYPKGKVHKVGDIIELTDAEVGNFSDGLIEKVEDEDENL